MSPRLRSILRSAPLVAVVAPLALVAPGCGAEESEPVASAVPAPTSRPLPAPGGPAPARATVQIVDFEYEPDPVRIAAGGTVTWINRDRAPHTSTDRAPAEIYDTGTLRKGGRASVTFDRPGRYRYYCVYHPFMEGKVDVMKEMK